MVLRRNSENSGTAEYLERNLPANQLTDERSIDNPSNDHGAQRSNQSGIDGHEPDLFLTACSSSFPERVDLKNRDGSSDSLLPTANNEAPRRLSVSRLNNLTSNIKSAAKWAYSPISPSTGKQSTPSYKIEYSVFKTLGNFNQIEDENDFQEHMHSLFGLEVPENYMSTESFDSLIEQVKHTIEIERLEPTRIAQGSSGSYFVYLKLREEDGEVPKTIGVYKPKDEEPYGPLSPKWTKWLHRTFFPCFFGRSCLIPNLGYISETAASILDQQLLSFIVPHTEVVQLKSSSFYSSLYDRYTYSKRVPEKIGSFQCFLVGYTDASSWFKEYPIPLDISVLPESSDVELNTGETISDTSFKWSKQIIVQFREELEKLVILDYIMRNTDRGDDNWMIKIEWKVKSSTSDSTIFSPVIKIGAIDSGLAFPWKHPDEWRSFPFGWLFLPLSLIGSPFSMKTRKHYLPLLTSKYWWETTVMKLKQSFQLDNDFKNRMWKKQLAVLKGQAFNVVEVLKLTHCGPLELTRREKILILDDEMDVPINFNCDILDNAIKSSIYDSAELQRELYSSCHDHLALPSHPTEMSPLLGDTASVSSFKSEPPLLMSGFEYNVNKKSNTSEKYDGEETNIQSVIIERIEKYDHNPPVFTWC